MKGWMFFLLGKVLAIAIFVVVFAFQTPNATGEPPASAASELPKMEASPGNSAKNMNLESSVPPVPRTLNSLSEAEKIRQNLEFLRQDAIAKAKGLAVAQAALERTRKDVEEKLKQIKEKETLLAETLQKEKEVKEERLKEALVFVEKMEPRKASPVIEGMDRDLVLALFKKLPPRVVTKLLENVSPKKATEWMEYYTRIRSGREFALLRELGLCHDPENSPSSGATEEEKTSRENATKEPHNAAPNSPVASGTPGTTGAIASAAGVSPTPTPPQPGSSGPGVSPTAAR
jgi:flagellar motility protein MotE (MotC chaperone)